MSRKPLYSLLVEKGVYITTNNSTVRQTGCIIVYHNMCAKFLLSIELTCNVVYDLIRSCVSHFGYNGKMKHEVSLSPSVSTNATELNMIFTKLLGISGAESASSNNRITVLGSGNPSDAVNLDNFLSKRSVINASYLCQGMNFIFLLL